MTCDSEPFCDEAREERDRLRAEVETIQARIKQITNWLRRQANAEAEPKAKAAFIEAHNAVLGIAEGRYSD